MSMLLPFLWCNCWEVGMNFCCWWMILLLSVLPTRTRQWKWKENFLFFMLWSLLPCQIDSFDFCQRLNNQKSINEEKLSSKNCWNKKKNELCSALIQALISPLYVSLLTHIYSLCKSYLALPGLKELSHQMNCLPGQLNAEMLIP